MKTPRFLLTAALALTVSSTSCVVVKVKKNPKSVDASAIAATDSASLNNPAEFLKSSMVKETLIKLVAENKDQWIKSFRGGVRFYRAALISQATKGVGIDDSFYNSDECQTFDLMKFKKDYRIVQMIAHTALFAGIAEIGHKELPDGLKADDNVKAVFELIKAELGVKIEKISDEQGYVGVSIKLVDIEGEEGVTAEMKEADSVEVLKLFVKRDVQEDNLGTMSIKVSIAHKVSEGETQEIEGLFNISREKGDGIYLINAEAKVGIKGQEAQFSRKLVIETVKDNSKKVKITDYINAGSLNEKVVVSTVSLDGTEVKWCKAGAEEKPTPVEECILKENCSPVPTMVPVVEPTPAPTTPGSNKPGQNNPGQNGGKA